MRKDVGIRITNSNKKRIFFFILLGLLTIFGLIIIFQPYLIIPNVDTITHVAWSEPIFEAPKATVTLTFTSKIAFTTNYPIHAKVRIQYFREGENDTNVFVHIVNPPAQAFKYPLDETPSSGLIKIIKSNSIGEGELDLEFTSAGSYGFTIYTGSSDYLGNMTVAYAGQDEEVIRISPPETRFQIEWTIRGFGIALIPISVLLAIFKNPKEEQKSQKTDEIIGLIQNFINKWKSSVGSSSERPPAQFDIEEPKRFAVEVSNRLIGIVSYGEKIEMADQLVKFASTLNKLGHTKFYINGGKSWRNFFSNGNELVILGYELIDKLK